MLAVNLLNTVVTLCSSSESSIYQKVITLFGVHVISVVLLIILTALIHPTSGQNAPAVHCYYGLGIQLVTFGILCITEPCTGLKTTAQPVPLLL